MLTKLEPDGQLSIAARRFRRTLENRNQVVIVTNKTPRVDSMLCAAAMEIHINELDSRIGITRIQDEQEDWYEKRFDRALVILIDTKLTSEFLYVLAARAGVMIIDSKESVFQIVSEHNAKYDVAEDSRVELGVPIRGYSAAFIGWCVSNRYVGNTYTPITIPPVLTLLNEYSAQTTDDTLLRTLPTTLYEYLETIYQGTLEQTRELLAGTEETLVAITEGYQSLRSAKSLVAMRIAKKHATQVTIDGYDIRALRINVPMDLMEIVGTSIRTEGIYVILYEIVGNRLYAQVHYGPNWSKDLDRTAANKEVTRLCANLQGEQEEYGFSFNALIDRPKLFKSASDIVVKSLLQNK